MTCLLRSVTFVKKSLLNNIFVYNFHYIYFPKTIPSKILLLASYFRSYWISDLLTILVCDMCNHSPQVKSENFSISQGKCNSFKEAIGRWHIPASSPKLNMFHWQNIVSRNQTKSRFWLFYIISVSSTQSFDWNLVSFNIWTNCQFIWSGKMYIWLSHWEFKKTLSTLLVCGHFIQIHSCMSICFSRMYTNTVDSR